MNRKTNMCLLLSATLLLGTAVVNAQRSGPDGPPSFAGPMELMGFGGMHGGKIVKGAPFSATATSETTRTLQDGSVTHQTSQVSMYRDSQGRSRHESSFAGFQGFGGSGGPKTMVTISDPVAGVHIMLDAEQKVAHKRAMRTAGTGTVPNFEARIQEREQKEIAAGLLKKESLGTQTINGVVAEGTRTTHIIPAGQIGNDKPLQVVSERWYSPDLQIVLKSTRSDPRFGTTTYAVTNLQRAEPATTLFTVPADFTVVTGGHGAGGYRHAAPNAMPPSVE